MRLPGLGGWSDDPAWATVYDWSVEHPRAGGLLWRLGIQSDLRRLYAATDELGTLAAGTRVLDVPCGGGVALRGLRPGQGVDYVAADIAQAMLDRTLDAARDRGVADQVTTRIADVGDLPFDDESVDVVVTFTGLHCFPDPERAVAEMTRVLRPGGFLTGSAVLTDTGLRHEPLRRAGRLAGLMGPMCSGPDVVRWLTAGGVERPSLDRSGAIAYFRGVRA
ncbi:class I SAM-dependent methyltransferase [Nocardioides sp. C4-1]|uniref:class I SAM-dependent methyltransferase n=1 Tax=Nocardioides sp. C4-1 TaxID=3151851 RepID=UPI003267AAB1